MAEWFEQESHEPMDLGSNQRIRQLRKKFHHSGVKVEFAEWLELQSQDPSDIGSNLHSRYVS